MEGKIKLGDSIYLTGPQGESKGQSVITKISKRIGVNSYDIEEAICGDIVTLYGIQNG